MESIPVAKVLSIRSAGRDEAWLRDMIYDAPSILGLGDLEPVHRERSQPQGGRLDLLLKNPEDDSMFEVELQLGDTDESHIIRTIEYWECEKRRWPRRSHTAVLVAERITPRFFNVVNLLSHAVPMIGIQANAVQIGESLGLHFTKIIDTYQEPEEDEPSQQVFDEAHWLSSAPAALECARWYRSVLEKVAGEVAVKYFESYLSMTVKGSARVWVNRRKGDRAFIEVKVPAAVHSRAIDFLNSRGAAFHSRGSQMLTFNVNLQQLEASRDVHEWIARSLNPESSSVALASDSSV
jgi:hypothetical protein